MISVDCVTLQNVVIFTIQTFFHIVVNKIHIEYVYLLKHVQIKHTLIDKRLTAYWGYFLTPWLGIVL